MRWFARKEFVLTRTMARVEMKEIVVCFMRAKYLRAFEPV